MVPLAIVLSVAAAVADAAVAVPVPAQPAATLPAPVPPESARCPVMGADGQPSMPCCFTNDAFAGVCRVAPAPDETCESILRYLNTPNTVGKTYCRSTPIRGGWKQVVCPPGER